MSDSFLFYRSFFEALDDISEQDQLILLKAVCKYALDGKIPEISGVAKGMFKLIKPQIDANTKRRADGIKGGRPTVTKSKTSGYEVVKPVVIDINKKAEPMVTDSEEKSKPNDNVNVNVNVNDNDKDIKKGRFAPPSLEEVKAYCQERNNGVNPETFIDFYASKGWKVGNQPMKDWKACVRTWERRDKTPDKGKPPDKIHFELERHYDIEELEKKLLRRNS